MAKHMNTKSKALRTYLFSIGGLIVIGALIIAVNLILGALNVRWDCTEENMHTLAKGTRQTLADLAKGDETVAIRFYFSRDVAELPPAVKNYARRVEDLLKEYKRYGKGKVSVAKLNPEPDSDAEDSARLDRVPSQPIGFDMYYFGLAVTCLEETETIARLSPQRENALEYEITRAIHRVLNPDKPRIGVISSLPVMGAKNQNPMMAMRGMGQTPPWAFVQYLQQDYEVEEIPKDSDLIAGEIDVLLIVHPKDLSDALLYAIDQYLLRGGRIIAFMDPLSLLGQQKPNPQMMGAPPPPDQPSSLGPLLAAWGVELEGMADEPSVIADTKFMLRIPTPVPGRPEQVLPTVIDLGQEAVNEDEIAISTLTHIRWVSGGSFRFTGETGLTRVVLLSSSDKAGFVEPYQAKFLDPTTGGRIRDGLKIDNTTHALGVRLEGTFTTAFPDGKPGDKSGEEDGEEDDKKEEKESGLKKSTGAAQVVLLADSDMLADPFAFQQQRNFQGRPEYTNNNLALLLNFLEWLAGDENLISLRSRGIKRRPLQHFNDMLADAQEDYQAEQKRLDGEATAARERLQKLMEKNPPVRGRRYHLSPEMEEEIKNLEKKQEGTEKRKKELRKEYRRGVEDLQKRLMFINIGLMPLVVALVGIALGLIKRRRTMRK